MPPQFIGVHSLLALIRAILLAVLFVGASLAIILFLFIRPFHKNNVHIIAGIYGKFASLFGVEIELRGMENASDDKANVYIGNHQNSWDLFTSSNAVRPNTVSVGKKSLKWIPLFGQVYWLSGNILIDRGNRSKAHGTIGHAAEQIKQRGISVWLFPEGTRSYGRGLLPFKTGAFYTAALAEVPVVPVVISNTEGLIKWNRWNNGKVIIEYLPEFKVESSDKAYIREVTKNAHQMMAEKLDELNAELGYKASSETVKTSKA